MFEYVVNEGLASDSVTVIRSGKMIGLIRSRQDIVSYYPSNSRIPTLNASSMEELKRMLEVVEKGEWSLERHLVDRALINGDNTPAEQVRSDPAPLRDGANAADTGASPLSDDQRLARQPSVANGR